MFHKVDYIVMDSLKVIVCSEENKEQWDEYVLRHYHASCYHHFVWKKIIEESFKHKCYYLMALSGDEVKGVFPLVHMKSVLFGNFMVSIPYFNYGGICISPNNREVQEALLKEAEALGTHLKVSHIEIREQRRLNCGLPVKRNKVSLHMQLPENHEELWKSLKAKVRNQVRRPEKEGEVEFISGGLELLEDFYYVFSVNMRRLGTPVYSKHFFANMLKSFPEEAKIRVLYFKGDAASVGFTIGNRNMMEIPWASSKKEYDKYSVNMCFYWNVLKQACLDGYDTFDFGRSTINEGSFHFKRQWGDVKSVPLYWHYWLDNGNDKLPELNPRNPKFQLAIALWKKAPLKMTQVIGPHIVKYIP